MLKQLAPPSANQFSMFFLLANLGQRRTAGGVRAPPPAPSETSSVRSGPSSTDLFVIEFANAELSVCALCTACVQARDRETGADNVASTFHFSYVRVEFRIPE